MSSAPGASSSQPFVQSGDELGAFLRAFWQRQVDAAETEPVDVRHPALPLARIKKVMKSDPEIKHMISADAPILFCKACEIFIAEVTARAFLNADACKRRTVNKSDVARALARSDMFDFLIDIVPREDTGQPGVKRKNTVEHAPTLPPAQRVHEQYHPPNMPMGALLHQSAAEKHETATPALGSPMALEQFMLPTAQDSPTSAPLDWLPGAEHA